MNDPMSFTPETYGHVPKFEPRPFIGSFWTTLELVSKNLLNPLPFRERAGSGHNDGNAIARKKQVAGVFAPATWNEMLIEGRGLLPAHALFSHAARAAEVVIVTSEEPSHQGDITVRHLHHDRFHRVCDCRVGHCERVR